MVWEKPEFEVVNLCFEVTCYVYTRLKGAAGEWDPATDGR
ncbi:MAG: pyrroloquinoline quinone precursor peptide PqqA [Actinomycetota bacterium]|nr:pyrroloquinoline quinone precursor peptide PqqA [Actinomycetota bacterium]